MDRPIARSATQKFYRSKSRPSVFDQETQSDDGTKQKGKAKDNPTPVKFNAPKTEEIEL